MRSISLAREIRPATVSATLSHWYVTHSIRASMHSLNPPPLPDSGLSPVLLTRARLLAAEHDKLSESLAESFDTKVAKRAGELTPVTKVLKEWDNANEVGASTLDSART